MGLPQPMEGSQLKTLIQEIIVHICTDAQKTIGSTLNLEIIKTNEPRHGKTNVLVSDLIRHKPGCTTTEDGQMLGISDLENRGIILSM